MAPAPKALPVRAPTSAATLAAAGCVALALRPWLLQPGARDLQLLIMFAALFIAGLAWPLPSTPTIPRIRAAAVLALGIAAFGFGRLLGGGFAPSHATSFVIAANTFAAISEEAFFRRFVYGVLEHRGTAIAVLTSAAAFAAVHLTVYGGWAMPLDITAGLVLSWQRAATGSWRVPAATHVLANLMVLVP